MGDEGQSGVAQFVYVLPDDVELQSRAKSQQIRASLWTANLQTEL